MLLRQPDEQVEDHGNQQGCSGDIEEDRRGIRLDAIRMQPAVLDGGDVAFLFQSFILVVDLVDELTVATDEVVFCHSITFLTLVGDHILRDEE